MTIIHMDTDEVRYVASLLNKKVDDMVDLEYFLQKIGSSISSAYYGGRKSNKFNRDLLNLRMSLRARISELEILSLRLQHEVDEWLAVDTERPFGRWHDERTIFEVGEWLGKGETILGLGAAAYVTSRVRSGVTYPGQMKFYGSMAVKDAAGVSGHLTHAGAQGFARHLADGAKKGPGVVGWGLAALEAADRGVEDWHRYEKGSEKAAAIAVDTAFVAAKSAGGVAFQGWVMGTVGVLALGAMATAGAPALLVAGAGFALWYGSGALFNWAADGLYDLADKGGLKDAIVEGGGKLIDGAIDVGKSIGKSAVKAVDSAAKSVVKGIASLF